MVLTAMSFAEGTGKPAIHAVVPVRVVKGLGVPEQALSGSDRVAANCPGFRTGARVPGYSGCR
jgi:hypothetical protein